MGKRRAPDSGQFGNDRPTPAASVPPRRWRRGDCGTAASQREDWRARSPLRIALFSLGQRLVKPAACHGTVRRHRSGGLTQQLIDVVGDRCYLPGGIGEQGNGRSAVPLPAVQANPVPRRGGVSRVVSAWVRRAGSHRPTSRAGELREAMAGCLGSVAWRTGSSYRRAGRRVPGGGRGVYGWSTPGGGFGRNGRPTAGGGRGVHGRVATGGGFRTIPSSHAARARAVAALRTMRRAGCGDSTTRSPKVGGRARGGDRPVPPAVPICAEGDREPTEQHRPWGVCFGRQ